MVVRVLGNLKSISPSPHHEINRPPNLLVKKQKREIMFFRAAQASELVGGVDFKHLGSRKRPFLHVRNKLLGSLKRVHK